MIFTNEGNYIHGGDRLMLPGPDTLDTDTAVWYVLLTLDTDKLV